MNNNMKQISENFYIKKDELYNDIISADKKARRSNRILFKRIVPIFIAITIIFTGCMTAYAASPSFRNLINLWFMTENKRQTEVPDGYKGIYTINDLNNIRNDLSSKYILMNDLTFSESDFAKDGAYEEGWVAIGDREDPFTGEFDGNGHIINNLILKQGEVYTGLFGVAKYVSSSDLNLNAYAGTIKNLGLKDCMAQISIKNEKNIYVGSIVADGNYIVNCFVDNANINADMENFSLSEDYMHIKNGIVYKSLGEVQLGGVSGQSKFIDSCYANVNISITDSKNHLQNSDLKDLFCIGGISSFAYNIVTSYFSGPISYNGNSYGSNEVLGYNTFIPYIFSISRFEQASNLINNSDLVSDSARRTLRGCFEKRQLNTQERDFLMKDKDTNEEFYVVWQGIRKYHICQFEDALLKTVNSNKEEFRKQNEADGIKSGINYCYTLDSGKSYKQDYFENFDFDNIWIMKNGVPVLRIFE